MINLLEIGGLAISDNEIDDLVDETKGYSGSDLKKLFTEAAMIPVRELSMDQHRAKVHVRFLYENLF